MSLRDLSDAHCVLAAVQAASDGDLDSLLNIASTRRNVFPDFVVYRLLLSFYPVETSESSTVTSFLESLRGPDAELKEQSGFSVDPAIASLSRKEALARTRSFKLQPLPKHTSLNDEGSLGNFVVEWARKLEQLNSAVQPAAEFVERFIEQDADLRLWYETYLVPLLRLQYDYYPQDHDMVSLSAMERMSGAPAARQLLQYSAKQHNASFMARDLQQVVEPWVRGTSQAKRRKLAVASKEDTPADTAWDPVFDWLLSYSTTDFNVAASAFERWSGPDESSTLTERDIKRHAQVGLAMIYECVEASPESQMRCKKLLSKSCSIANIEAPDFSLSDPEVSVHGSFIDSLDESDLLPNALESRTNQLTLFTHTSVNLAYGLLVTADVLSDLGLPWKIGDLARACIFGSERRHKDELRRLLQHVPMQTRKEIDWRSVRQQLLWLQSWSSSSPSSTDDQAPAFLARLSPQYIEIQTLDALLKAAQYGVVKETYLSTSAAPLPTPEVEARVVAAIFEAYDNATNGNRTRGGMKRAQEILRVFRPDFTQSDVVADIEFLIKATHSLSFYQLTLQHGVPFKPVAIRVQKDPLSLVEKVLEQDTRAYTKLDDLLEIGRNLVRAHLPSRSTLNDDSESLDSRVMEAEHRITYRAIMAALNADDFDTAYAYITTRLHTATASILPNGFTDDTSWRAAYAAGRYRPSTSPKSLTARINSLTQRMELLSRALMLAPAGEALSGILATWRRYEQELDGLKSEAAEEERVFDTQADASLPGGFGIDEREADVAETKRAIARRTGPSGSTYEEEAPLGLFDVARGAASALRKSAAFPLGSRGLADLKIGSGNNSSQDLRREQAGSPTSDDGGRVRKRDMVANMVGSGLGWVLGAQPRERTDYDD